MHLKMTFLKTIEHFNEKKWSIKVANFSGETKAQCTKAYSKHN